jgi:hypothetical protein
MAGLGASSACKSRPLRRGTLFPRNTPLSPHPICKMPVRGGLLLLWGLLLWELLLPWGVLLPWGLLLPWGMLLPWELLLPWGAATTGGWTVGRVGSEGSPHP